MPRSSPALAAPILCWRLEHPGIPGEGLVLKMPSAGINLGSNSRSSGGCRYI
jgi:hypothetical protein